MMRRSPLQQKTPLTRKTPMERGTSTLARTPFKKKARKHRPEYHDKRYTEACRGEPCYLKVPGVCLGAAGRKTVVPCHSNQGAHGKGAGIKAKDEFSVPGCMACHSWLDQNTKGTPKEVKFAAFDAAFARWEPVRTRKLNKERE